MPPRDDLTRKRSTPAPRREDRAQYDDPIFLAKLKAFVLAMGKRYGGNPNLAFLDIRSYGNWGEDISIRFGGTPISTDALREHVGMHRDAFKSTLLVLPWGSKDYEQGVTTGRGQGIGLRRDGICGNSDGRETARCLGLVPPSSSLRIVRVPEAARWWDGKTVDGHGYRLADCVERGRPATSA